MREFLEYTIFKRGTYSLSVETLILVIVVLLAVHAVLLVVRTVIIRRFAKASGHASRGREVFSWSSILCGWQQLSLFSKCWAFR
jgi:hypothetical protein